MLKEYLKFTIKQFLSLMLVFFIIFSFSMTKTINELNNKSLLFQEPHLFVSTNQLSSGDCFAIFIENVKETDIHEVDFSPHYNPIKFFPYKDGIMAFVGVSYHVTSGKYPLNIKVLRESGITLVLSETMTVLPKNFAKQYLYVSKELENKRDANLWESDSHFIEKAKANPLKKALFEGPFIMPVSGRISTEYGLIRYVNNKLNGRHAGLDIATKKGTPIKASNNGKITLAKSLNVTGNTIIIDHGMNIFSAYCHLDEFSVKEGDYVNKNDIIGKVGSTGFSTGPHLHWTISIGSTFTNPRIFLKEDPLSWL